MVGDPARANMLTALLNGDAYTASELSLEAGVTKQTASSHLSKLVDGGLVAVEAQGRHRYYRLADADVAGLLETLMGVAARAKALRTRPGPKEPQMRHARVCYDHLAGDLGVGLFDAFKKNKWILPGPEKTFALTKLGRIKVQTFGVDIEDLEQGARPLCRACLDWSVRRHHLAGALGAAILDEILERGWATQKRGSRVLEFTRIGEAGLRRVFAFQETPPPI
ncbi:ArsR family transcriptional regulator [Candidatus Viadribacter manganicus]|uniref:ArsR family transcriptional regulator n=2 Tax=Candidatus Viadribacter manganicus TaxID=1759059 RepID=A0A1B1AES3_9PROT|nr:ArsR family transcriptional regulator [Candidatus Viadribacter manganicus]